MADAALKLMTADEFLLWDDGTDTRYQLIQGQPVAMAPPRLDHGTISMNLGRQLGNRLAQRPSCRAIGEAGLRISDQTFVVADVVVTCTRQPSTTEVVEPIIIIEILSPSTRRDDLAFKLPAYQRIQSVREIWLIDSERRWVQLWRRDGAARWIVEDLVGSAEIVSAVLGDRIGLDDLYLNVDLEETA